MSRAAFAALLAAGAALALYSSNAAAASDEPDWWGGDDGGGIDWGTDMVSVGGNRGAFLDMIAMSEIGPTLLAQSNNGYDVLVGGGRFTGYADHPRTVVQTRYGASDAAGRYQIMAAVPGLIKTDTWDWASKAAGVRDFSPASQDAVALYLIRWRGALGDVDAGRFASAVSKCNKEWASLSGSPYGQRTNSLDLLASWYQAKGGWIA